MKVRPDFLCTQPLREVLFFTNITFFCTNVFLITTTLATNYYPGPAPSKQHCKVLFFLYRFAFFICPPSAFRLCMLWSIPFPFPSVAPSLHIYGNFYPPPFLRAISSSFLCVIYMAYIYVAEMQTTHTLRKICFKLLPSFVRSFANACAHAAPAKVIAAAPWHSSSSSLT